MTTDAHDDAIRASEPYQRAMEAVRALAAMVDTDVMAPDVLAGRRSVWALAAVGEREAKIEKALLALAKSQQPTEPRKMVGLESKMVHPTHRGVHDEHTSWCHFYGCTLLQEEQP